MNAYETFSEQVRNLFEGSEKKLSEKKLEEDAYDKALFQLKNYLHEYEELVKVMLTPDGMIPAETPELRPEELIDVPFCGRQIKARKVYDPDLADQIALDHKSAGRLFKFIKEKGRKMANNGVYGCSSDVMSEIIKEYYALDDKAEFIKEQTEAEEKAMKAKREKALATLNRYADRIANTSEELKGLSDSKRKSKLRTLEAKYRKDFGNSFKLSLLIQDFVKEGENPDEIKMEIEKALADFNESDEKLKAIKNQKKAEQAKEESEDTEESEGNTEEETEDSTEDDSKDDSEEEEVEEADESVAEDNPFEEKPKKPEPKKEDKKTVFFKPKKAKEMDGQINLFDLFGITQ